MSSCCAIAGPDTSTSAGCPGCGQKGRPVTAKTVVAILKEEVDVPVRGEPLRFCVNPACAHLYFSDGWTAMKMDARVRVGLKEHSDPVPLCYCFAFTQADVLAEVQATGSCTISERITAEVRANHCACEVNNPSGHCCLGDVRRVIKEARAALPMSNEGAKMGERP